jgi:hypothetical protein
MGSPSVYYSIYTDKNHDYLCKTTLTKNQNIFNCKKHNTPATGISIKSKAMTKINNNTRI